MNRYNFTFDQELSRVSQSIMENYPDAGIVERMKERKSSRSKFIGALKRLVKGQAQARFIEIENSWFKIQDELQNLPVILDAQKEETVTFDTHDENGMVTGQGTRQVKVPLNSWEILRTDFEAQAVDEKAEELTDNQAISDAYIALQEKKEVLENSRSKLETGNYWELLETVTPATETEEEVITVTRESQDPLPEGAFYPWLKVYRGVELAEGESPRPDPQGVIPNEDVKEIIRTERDSKVRSMEDSLADVSKMVSLLITSTSRIYSVLSETQKSKLDPIDRGAIEYVFTKFSEINTRADRQFAIEGTGLVDKLLNRESSVADIVDAVKAEATSEV